MARKIWASLIVCYVAIFCSLTSADGQLDAQVSVCEGCHGTNTVTNDPKVPEIQGQHFFYIYTQLKDYKANRRSHQVMTLMSAGLDKKMMKSLAQYYSEQKWVSRAPEETIDESVASNAMTAGQCTQCHGNYKGLNGIPRLAGQKASYLEETMRAFKQKERMNAGAKSALFATMADAEIAAIANFLANQ